MCVEGSREKWREKNITTLSCDTHTHITKQPTPHSGVKVDPVSHEGAKHGDHEPLDQSEHSRQEEGAREERC